MDTTFNGTGYLTINGSAGGSGNDQIYDMATDSQNRIVAVGSSVNASGNLDMTVWRLNEDGTTDTSFATAGVFSHDSAAGGSNADVGYGVVISSDDQIYVTGTSVNGSSDFDMVLWRLNSDGTLDTNFNGTGFVVDDSAAGGGVHDQGNDVTLDGFGKIVVVGFSDQSATNRDLAVWRYNPNGSLDSGFNSTGRFTHDGAAGGEDDSGNGVVIDSANNLFVTGRSDSGANLDDMTIWKISSSGALDTGFNSTGFLTHNGAAGGSDFDSGSDIVIADDGDLIVTGFSRNSDGNNDMVLWRVTQTGTFDTTFAGTGFTSFDVAQIFSGNSNDTGEKILIDSENRIVVAGSGSENLCIWRYLQDGTLDIDFNTDGFFSHDAAAGGFAIDSGTSVIEDSLNRLYFGGFSENLSGNFDATFWRLQ
ncbi:MAG: SBBP repeat-containing protein [Pseudomonadota bacterium]